MSNWYSYRRGDLFKISADALAHGCNMQGVMGAGIAAQFKAKDPEMYRQYALHCKEGAAELGGVFSYLSESVKFSRTVVYNLFTQNQPGANANYVAVADSLDEMCRRAENSGIKSIGMPQIGCGIGGLKWPAVSGIIESIAKEHPKVRLIVVEYQA